MHRTPKVELVISQPRKYVPVALSEDRARLLVYAMIDDPHLGSRSPHERFAEQDSCCNVGDGKRIANEDYLFRLR